MLIRANSRIGMGRDVIMTRNARENGLDLVGAPRRSLAGQTVVVSCITRDTDDCSCPRYVRRRYMHGAARRGRFSRSITQDSVRLFQTAATARPRPVAIGSGDFTRITRARFYHANLALLRRGRSKRSTKHDTL